MTKLKRFNIKLTGLNKPCQCGLIADEAGAFCYFDEIQNWKSPEELRELREQLKKVYSHLVIEKPQTEYELGRSEMAKNIIRDLDEEFSVEGEK